jgi:hypothetical protein
MSLEDTERRTFTMTDSPDQRLANELQKILGIRSILDNDPKLEDYYAILTAVQAARAEWERELIGRIAQLEVKGLPSDDPELRYWQGYADGQLAITELAQAIAPPAEKGDTHA